MCGTVHRVPWGLKPCTATEHAHVIAVGSCQAHRTLHCASQELHSLLWVEHGVGNIGSAVNGYGTGL